jgi:hypothetical protein
MRAIGILILSALAFYGADVTGTWKGSIEVADPANGEKVSTQVTAHFDQKSNDVSGKIGRTQDDQLEPIRNAKLDGKTLTFEVQPPEATAPMKFNLVLVSDDRIEGDMKGTVDVGSISGKVVLTRSKQTAAKQ